MFKMIAFRMIAFRTIGIALALAVAPAIGGEYEPLESTPPVAGAGLQQPDWLAPQRTVRLAQLPREGRPAPHHNGPMDIGKLLAPSLNLAAGSTPMRDEHVSPASLTLQAEGSKQSQELLESARELARHATVIEDFDRVLDLCHQAIEAGPTPAQATAIGRFGAWASNARGECLLAHGNEHDAFECFQEALELDPTCWEALHNRAVTLAAHDRGELALDDFKRVIELAPHFGSAYRNRGELLASLGQLDEALADYSQAIVREPNSASHRYARATVHRRLDHLTEAVKDLNAAIRLDPELSEAYSCRADIYATLGYWEKACDDYQQALQLDPRSSSAYQGLAWLLATCPHDDFRDPAKAIEAAERAERFAAQPTPQLQDTLAAAYASAGRYDEAIVELEQAIVASEGEAAAPLRARLELYRAGTPYRLVK